MSEKEEASAEPEIFISGASTTDSESVLTELSVVSGSQTVGNQSFEYADVQIRVETAAHQRRVEQQRLEHELREATRDNNWRRVRENVTFGVVTLVVVLMFAGSASVALTTDDPVRQTFAQGLATTIAGAIGGAFTGYAVAERKK